MITVKDVNFKYQKELIYENLNFNVYKDEHVVLVGPNGSGKTTLMKLLAKELTPDSGSISILPTIKVGYLDQYMSLDANMVVKTYLYNVYEELFLKEEEMNGLYEEITTLKDYSLIDRKLNYAGQISDYLLENNFYQIKSEISNVINGLGLSMNVLNYKIEKLSSGMRSKIILAKLLLEENDLLLLDEPTNFLDKEHIEWLTKFLVNYEKAFIVISHQESFLKDIAKVVLEVNGLEVERYKGNFNYYLKERDIRTNIKKRSYETQSKLIKKEEEFISKNIHRSSTSKRAKSRRKMLDKLVRVKPVFKDLTYKFDFPVKLATGKDVLVINDLEIGYDYPLIEPLSVIVRKEEKVAITGENGVGKTTLIKTILNEHSKINGNFKWDKNVKVSYLKQDDFYLTNDTAKDIVREVYNNFDDKEIYSLLATYGITFEMANRPINTLSGGEQMKIKIALLKNNFGNVLILDEPTNHLDTSSKKALKEALINYTGTLILVSHDSEFYDEICDYEISLY